MAESVHLAAEAYSLVGEVLTSGDTLQLAALVLLLRLVTWSQLRRAQSSVRSWALPVSEGGSVKHSFALYSDLALRSAVLLLLTVNPYRLEEWGLPFYEAGRVFVIGDSPLFARHEQYAWEGTADLAYTLPLWGACLAAWYFTQRNLYTIGMPPAVWNDRRLRTQVWHVLVVGVFAAFLASVATAVALLVLNVVALLVSFRPADATTVAGAAPSTAAPVTADWAAPTSSAPHSTPPVSAGNPRVPATAPPAPAGASASAPVAKPSVPVAATPAPAATPYVPTQIDHDHDHDVDDSGIPAHQPLRPNEARTLGTYQLLGRIGSGGMGTVYLARRQGSATQVALKTINPSLVDDPELLRRFERETEVLAMVPSAYTAQVLDTGVADGRPYLAMELLDGQTLNAHLNKRGPFRSAEALRSLALAMATALADIHRLGLVHRDLKPANVMLTTAGPRLLDFGIATLMDSTRITRTGMGVGTLTYMAPEQFGDTDIGPAADIWAWACCIICAAHGSSPFTAAGTGAIIRRIVDTGPDTTAVDALHRLDPTLADATRRALTLDVADRPANGTELLKLLTDDEPPAVAEEIATGWHTLML
ncbi:serine/threonine-protein kinase [Streptomyces sp. NPDC101112]|uniref:serine/threonine-protein kinase n=1 Tax=Streptomyces sp. NPDC101112 TaxID=3366105 RepID=UPI003804F90A